MKYLNLENKKRGITRGIANKGFNGMRSSSPASIFRLG